MVHSQFASLIYNLEINVGVPISFFVVPSRNFDARIVKLDSVFVDTLLQIKLIDLS